MTSQYDFSGPDWNHVAMTPVLVGWSVAKAEDSGFYGSIKETRTLVSAIAAGADGNPATSLIAEAAATDTENATNAFHSMSPEDLAEAAVNACGELTAILERTATAAEADGYRSWVMNLARTVADAAKEQGVRVSPAESVLLGRLSAALAAD